MSKVDVTVQQYLRSRLPLDAKFGPYATIAARNLIPAEDRYPMMVVGVEDTDGFGTNAIYFLKDGVTNSDWELIAFGSGQSYQPQEQTWVWSDGVDAGGVALDFVIPGAIAGEVASIDSCILFVGGSVQRNTTDFELQTTTVVNDTIRILNTTAAEREATVTVQLWYNRVGEGIPLPTVLFTQLQDVFSSYAGHANKLLKINATEDGIEPAGSAEIDGNFAVAGQAKGGSVVIPYSAAASFDLDNGNIQKMVLTGNVTSLSLANKINGSSYRLVLEQGGTGGYTVTIPGATFGSRTDASVDNSGGAGTWEPTDVGDKMIFDVTVEPDGDTFYTIETIGV